jgi:hypothetical protein
MKHYSPAGRMNHGRPLKRLLETLDRNGSTSGVTPWQLYDDDDDDDDDDKLGKKVMVKISCLQYELLFYYGSLVASFRGCTGVLFYDAV